MKVPFNLWVAYTLFFFSFDFATLKFVDNHDWRFMGFDAYIFSPDVWNMSRVDFPLFLLTVVLLKLHMAIQKLLLTFFLNPVDSIKCFCFDNLLLGW